MNSNSSDGDNPTRLTHEECKIQIKKKIDRNETFGNVKDYFKQCGVDDDEVVLAYYSQLFLAAMPKKGKEYLQSLFEKSDENVIIKWIDVVYNHKSNDELKQLLQNAIFYKCLTNLEENNEKIDFSSFFTELRKDFHSFFFYCQNLQGILEIFRCLLRCQHLPLPNNSRIFYDAVINLWCKCGFEDYILNLEAEETAQTYPEHKKLSTLVDNFTKIECTIVLNLIKGMFKPTNISVICEGTKSSVEIEGYNIILSKVNDKLNQKMKNNEKISQVKIQASYEFVIDQSLHLPGISVSIAAKNVKIPHNVEINLSGNNAPKDKSMETRAKDAEHPGENGTNGKDGRAGQSSGHFGLFAENIEGKENLILKLNGGNGHRGQDGGNGADGKDGVGHQLNDVFNTGHTFLTGLKQCVNVALAGNYSRLFDGMQEKKNPDGSVVLVSDSPYYFSTHTLEFYGGSDGGRGGKGGKNGKGGQGGKRGRCEIKVNEKDMNDEIQQVGAKDGEKGIDGLPGENGDSGNEGWDIALINSTLGNRIVYGESQKEKLFIDFSSKETDKTVYIRSRDTGKGSDCYAEIIPRPCAKAILTEKVTEYKDENERSGESIAVEADAIDMASLTQNYQESIASDATDQEAEVTEKNGLDKVYQLTELWTDLEDGIYKPKARHQPLSFYESSLDGYNLNDDESSKAFWKATIDFSIEELLDFYDNDNDIRRKLRKKQAIYKLRFREIEASLLNPRFDLKFDNLTFINENYQQYCLMFNFFKNLKIDGKPFEFYVPIIANAFEKKDVATVASYGQKLCPKTFKKAKSFIDQLPVPKSVEESYDSLPDDIKKLNVQPLFYYIQLYNDILIDDVFFKSFPVDEGQLSNIQAFLTLNKRRTTQAMKFQKEIHQLGFENEIIDCEKPLEQKLQLLFESVGNMEASLYLQKELKFICENFPAVGYTFINSLLFIFDIEGCHIDIITLKYLTDTIFNACKMFGSINCFIFPSILMITKQDEWIDNFFVFNIESFLKCHLKKKSEMIKILNQFEDENLKILCTEKFDELILDSNAINEKDLLILLDGIKKYDMIYPQIKNVKLTDWNKVIERMNFTKKDHGKNYLKDLSEDKKKLLIFWCSKLIDHFDIESVQDSIDLLKGFFCYDKNVIGRLMHRLCDGGNVINKTTKPLKEILDAALKCLESQNITKNTEFYKLARELLSLNNSSAERKLSELKTLCEKSNSAYDFFLIEEILKLLNIPIKTETNISEKILACVKIINDNKVSPDSDKSKFDTYKDAIEKEFAECNSEIDKDLFLLEIINQLIYHHCKFKLRNTQKIAILCALKNNYFNKNKNGILQQIGTGEGKTLIIAVVSIISVLNGHKVNIVTSSSVLAKRDVSNPPCKALYDAFALNVDHICYEDPERRKQIYSKSHIIFGDLTSYQRDYLMDHFYSTHISNREFDIVIADEVDSLLLDNGLNTLYLSHIIADFEMLHSLIIQIWNLANIHIKSGGDCKTAAFYDDIYHLLFPVISWKNISETMKKTDAKNFQKILIINEIIDEKGNIKIFQKKKLLEKLNGIQKNYVRLITYLDNIMRASLVKQQNMQTVETEILAIDNFAEKFSIKISELECFINILRENDIIGNDNKVNFLEESQRNEKFKKLKDNFTTFFYSTFIYKFDEIMENLAVDIPEHLRSYVQIHLKEFITNAEIAYHMELDVSYRIRMSLHDIVENRIIITDRDTGVDLPTTQWNKGLHQFLQLKHGLRLTTLSTKAVFISNITFLKMFNQLYGFSGTLGADAEKEQLQEFYSLNSLVLPSSNVKQFYEERTIITKSTEEQSEQIFYAIKEKMDENRSVLVIADSSKQAMHLKEKIEKMAKECIKEGDELQPYINAIPYTQDSDKFIYGDGDTKLDRNVIIFATNLAGRGTDILLTNELKEKGGLHVIISFLPRNIRIEEQAFGRSARCGECGTAQLIICDETIKDEASVSIVELKWKRNINEENRIKKIRDRYENKLKVEEKCFSSFCSKFQDLKNNEVRLTKNTEKCYKIFFQDLLDQWAIFLDRSEYESKSNDERIKAAEAFCDKLKIYENLVDLQPLNVLNYAMQKLSEKEYACAKLRLHELGEKFPAYLPESQYYSVYLSILMMQNAEKTVDVEKMLNDAKIGFTKRLADFKNHISIVNTHKIDENKTKFESDIFNQQQQMSMQLIKKVLESIDAFFGKIIESHSFVNEKISEEASMFLYKYFSLSKNYGENAIINNHKIKNYINEEHMKSYCLSNGLCVGTIAANLKSLQTSNKVTVEDLKKVMEIPTWTDFWDEMLKLKLITDISDRMFVDISRLPKLSAAKINEFLLKKSAKDEDTMFQHIMITKDEWKELDILKIYQVMDAELLDLLIENEILIATKSGKLAHSKLVNTQFTQFHKISKMNLLNYGIPENETDMILEALEKEGILKKIDSENYGLSSSVKIDKDLTFMSWYENVMMKMIKEKLTFPLVYQTLIYRNSRKSKESILETFKSIPNFIASDEDLIKKLIENDILEKSNVNLKALNNISGDENIIKKQWEHLWETQAQYNILKALEKTEKFIERNFGKENSKLFETNVFPKLSSNPIVDAIIDKFNECAAIRDKFETFDAELKILSESALFKPEEKHLLITHGLSHLISFKEKRWTSDTLYKAGLITGFGIAQAAVGCATFIYTGGSAPVLVAIEGLSDTLFGVKAFASGQCKNYRKHKAISLSVNATIFSSAELTKFAKNLPIIKSWLTKENVEHVARQAIPHVLPLVNQLRITEALCLQNLNATNFAVQEIFTRIKSFVDAVFTSEENQKLLREIAKITLQNLKSNEKNATNDQFKEWIKPYLLQICYFMVTELRSAFANNGEIDKEKTLEIHITTALKSPNVQKQLESMSEKLRLNINKLRASLMPQSAIINTINRKTSEEEVTNFIKSWQNEIQNESKNVLEEELKIPANCQNDAECQKILDSLVSRAQNELQKSINHNNGTTEKPNFQDESLKVLFNDLQTSYYNLIEQFQFVTRDPDIFAVLALTNLKIDFFTAEAISQIIKHRTSKSVKIKNSDLEKLDDDEIIIKQNYDDDEHGERKSVYDQILSQLPELAMFFEDKKAFERELAAKIVKIPGFFSRHLIVCAAKQS